MYIQECKDKKKPNRDKIIQNLFKCNCESSLYFVKAHCFMQSADTTHVVLRRLLSLICQVQMPVRGRLAH